MRLLSSLTTLRARLRLLILTTLLGAVQAQALTVIGVTPQGEVAQVSQVVVRFDQDAVRLGDPRAPAPMRLHCEPTAAVGQGRWTSAREWVYDFQADLPPGTRCEITPVAGFRSSAGAELQDTTIRRFHTGGPFVQRIAPNAWQPVEEEQAFVLRLNGAATPESLRANVWCALDGLGERVPVQLLEGKERDALLKNLQLDELAAHDPQRVYVLQCARRFTPGSRVQLVYGKGVATPGGIVNQVERRFAFEVREPFTASVSCERENAQAACMPIRPVELTFSAPVPRAPLEAARLSTGKLEFEPILDDDDTLVEHLRFEAPLPERTEFTLHLPPGLQDASGRPLANADSFPLRIATGPMPPLVKFAAAPFGVVERLAEGPGGPALLPLTLRRVEPQLQAQALQIGRLQPQSDAEIIDWFTKVQRYDDWHVLREQAERDVHEALPAPIDERTKREVESRTISLLAGLDGVQVIDVPPSPARGETERPFEVIGVPLPAGFQVLEVSSRQLGAALLDPDYGPQRRMVVRTSVLVTNLAVHFKLGRENALAWVTTLDRGEPVAGARVQVSDCAGKLLATAQTDAQGLARFKDLATRPPDCGRPGDYIGDFQQAYFVSARAARDGAQDLAFTWSSWQRGIEPWRFGVPTSTEPTPDVRAHTIFDRTLLRAGETVSMKHLIRTETSAGFGLPRHDPDELVITHVGSGQEFTQPLAWRATASGGRSAESEFALSPLARLGLYQVTLRGGAGDDAFTLDSGEFRVEEFRLPVMQGRVGPADGAPLVGATRVPVQVQVGYVGGGPATSLPVRVSALTRVHRTQSADYEAFSFSPPRKAGDDAAGSAAADNATRVVADKLPATLDREGLGQVVIEPIAPSAGPRDLVVEATYADPNGELQTLRGTHTLWPAAVIAGIKAADWVSVGQATQVQALALDLEGKPKAGVPLDVRAVARVTTTSRKRMVGGFYAYDSHTETRDLGTVCTGSSNVNGLLECKVKLTQPGEIELVASARDDKGRAALAAGSVWVTAQGELWFGGENHDRMDVLAEKKAYLAGDTARLQVRMPFRRATALVAVEREGILHTEVVTLRGDDPTIQLKIGEDWGPNVYVSVLALRGRVHDVPWYSFFTWGYKAPRAWWQAFWTDSKDYAAPTALVDLSKPAFRLGMAELRIAPQANQLAVEVAADRESYPVRGKARVTIRVRTPDGQPAAHAEVALAAVDQALLELMPNRSWDLLDAMLTRRAWGVETATAQMEIVGRRHYGRKAVPAGGDGGAGSPTRELLDTLLLWQPRVPLDANGEAVIEVPLNDALTTFQVVAVADFGTQMFGTGETAIRSSQDLQIISGLPPLVREGDQFRAQLTLRNTTAQPMRVEVAPRATLLELATQTVDLPAGEARELHWDVTAPEQLAATRAEAMLWEVQARDLDGKARDALKISQRIIPAVPLTVQQASLVQLDGPYAVEIAPPADALPASGTKRGGIQLALQPRLADGLPAIRDWFARYPYSCLEQTASKAIGLGDTRLWQATMAQLPAYLDADGLVNYFPPRAGDGNQGSDTLTAWLIAATDEASRLDPDWKLPPEARQAMIQGLTGFVQGRIERRHWSPRPDLDVRKLAAIEALSRVGAAQASMLASLAVAPNQWPTSAVLDWISILRRVRGIPEQPQKLEAAMQVLRARLSVQGARLAFSTEREDAWWWLMAGGDVNAARLLLAVMDDPAWQDDLGRLLSGFIARQQGGAWNTTTANLWGSLALRQFSRQHESAPVAGVTRATLGDAHGQVTWSQVKPLKAGAPSPAGRFFGAPAQPGQLVGNTLLLPWPTDAATLAVDHQGSGRPWLTLQSLAAVQLEAPFASGYQIRKTITPVQQADKGLPPGQYTRGDILRVTLEVTGASDMTWVAVTDPIPAGATILGSGLGRDSAIATQGERRSGAGWPAFEERSFESYRSYYRYLPKGTVRLDYSLRLNNAGRFQLPPSRVAALYAPEMFGETPNAVVTVRAP
ncbi:MAG TPA: MG2 domain-containing protein [Ottowia sp.]|uniref:alpha-2-macroglobulin family protein n=1 Tax=Ottowia sp. TaxID=1898956 RepID=UPI002BF935B9|nr:MG2 domain-containing protein [Ottowia sp.]HMN22644.1 MG2 domain-containing protein [Ottowia sp.]